MTESWDLWSAITAEAHQSVKMQPELASFFHRTILNQKSFDHAISYTLASRLADATMTTMTLQSLIIQALQASTTLSSAMKSDLLAHYHRDAACDQYQIPLLYFKGYHAIQAYRIAHYYWLQGRQLLAVYLQHRISALFDVDIHPAASIGAGLMLDHATGLVIGETAKVGDDVSVLHNVTLGGSSKMDGKRHPHVGKGVLLSAGSKLLGPITIGDFVKVGAGSLVLEDVPAHSTVVGVPARVIGQSESKPAETMNHNVDAS